MEKLNSFWFGSIVIIIIFAAVIGLHSLGAGNWSITPLISCVIGVVALWYFKYRKK